MQLGSDLRTSLANRNQSPSRSGENFSQAIAGETQAKAKSAVPAQDPATRAAPAAGVLVASSPVEEVRPNTVTVPSIDRIGAFAGRGTPGNIQIPGLGTPAFYATGTLDTFRPGSSSVGNPGAFITFGLAPGGVNAASMAAALSPILGGGPTTDALAGALLKQYETISATLNSDRFKQVLPNGAKVTPQIALSIPSHDLARGLVSGDPSEFKGAQIGIGMSISIPGKASPLGDGTVLWANTRIAVDEAIKAAKEGREIPTERTAQFGLAATNVPVPGTNQKLTVGLGIGTKITNFDSDAPWQIKLSDGTEHPMPAPLALVMNGLTGANSPVNLQKVDLADFGQKMGLTPEVIRGAVAGGEAIGNATSVALEAGALLLAAKANPIGGIIGGVGLVMKASDAIDQVMDKKTSEALVAQNMHRADVALPKLTEQPVSTAELSHFAKHISAAIDMAVSEGKIDEATVRSEWTAAARAPIAGADVREKQKAAIANLVVGDFDRAQMIATNLGDSFPDYAGEGLASALSGVSSQVIDKPPQVSVEAPPPKRLTVGHAGVPGVGQVEIRVSPDDKFSAHGRNNAQHPLPEATDLRSAQNRAREIIGNGGFSKENLIPLQPEPKPAAPRAPSPSPVEVVQEAVSNVKNQVLDTLDRSGIDINNFFQPKLDAQGRAALGYAGVPGMGQVEIRYELKTDTYSAHGANDDAQYPLPQAQNLEQAQQRAREMIRHGGIAPENLIPLRP